MQNTLQLKEPRRLKSANTPLVSDRDYATNWVGERGEHGEGQIEVELGVVAPASLGALRALVRSRDSDASTPRIAPSGFFQLALKLEAGSTAEPTVEESIAQSSGVRSIPNGVKVSVSTCTTCIHEFP